MGLCGVRADMMRSAWRHSAECVRGLCGVRGDMVRSLCAGRAEPFGGERAGRMGRYKKRDKRDRRDREFCGVGG